MCAVIAGMRWRLRLRRGSSVGGRGIRGREIYETAPGSRPGIYLWIVGVGVVVGRSLMLLYLSFLSVCATPSAQARSSDCVTVKERIHSDSRSS